MAKLYDFRFVVRYAIFDSPPGMVTVPYGCSDDVYHEECGQWEYKDALAHLQALSDAEPRSHAAFLSMKYRDDRRPPGFGELQPIYRRRED